MKFFKFLFRFIAGFLLLLIVILATTLTTPEQTPLEKSEFYHQWKEILATATLTTADNNDSLKAGWAKVSITPSSAGPMAGYGNRRGKPFTQIHDSVYVRTVVLKKGNTRAAIVSGDLLIIPPTVTVKLKELLSPSDIPFENIYLGATHTHNSIGGWGTGVSGLFFSGSYNPDVEVRIAEAILQSLRTAEKEIEPVSLTYREALNTANINNRLIGEEGNIDPEIRGFELTGTNNKKLTFTTFGAHSTTLSSRTMQLSRDWPGVLVDSLDHQKDNFGIYMAGAVGSMSPNSRGDNDIEAMGNQGTDVFRAWKTAYSDTTLYYPELTALTLPLPLGDPAPRLTSRWALRSWVFNRAFGEYPNEIMALRMGNILMIGVPCDFSGELMADIDRYAKGKGLNLIVTGFNGGYMGYVTDDRWYDLDKYETVTMNWFGPYKGAYFQEVIKDLIDLME